MQPALLVSLLTALLLPAAAKAQRHHHEEHVHRHEVALFLGSTIENHEDDKESFFTIGGDYEFRFLPRVGISTELEYVTGVDTGVFAFPVVFHVYEGLMVMAGPGWEASNRRLERLGKERNFLVRTGVQYSFEIAERVSLIPAVDFDFVKESEAEPSLGEPSDHGGGEAGGWETVFVFGIKLAFAF